MTTASLRTALFVPVPEAEPIVAEWRVLFDPSATHGVPPHITLIFPYLSSDRCDNQVIAELQSYFEQTPAFDFRLSALGEFPGVLFISPEPEEPFVKIIRSLVDKFPEAPPYGGVFPKIIPHLTVAHTCDGSALARMRQTIEPALPIECRAREVFLMRENLDGEWLLNERFTLA